MSFRSLVKKFIPNSLFRLIEPYGHLIEAVLFNILYGFPGKNLKVIGVTGTNGKTSTCYLIHRMLQKSGFKTGLMSTVAWGIGEDIKPQIHHMTNVPVRELMQRLRILKKANIDYLVLETTSQGLAQNRVWGVGFSIAVLTNITHEHLDYHRTFERYRKAKRQLFIMTNHNRRGFRSGVINAEDPNAEYFTKAIKTSITYGLNKGELRASSINKSPSGSSYTAKIDGDIYNVKCNLPGTFNISNSLAAVGVGRILGLSKSQIEKGIAALESVEGRMNRINEGQEFDVIVDFAHTPDSFEKLFQDIRPIVRGKLIVMFGSPGRRDEAKRTSQGELAGQYADEIILTEEDDRDIDGMEIINQIKDGVEKYHKVLNRDIFIEPDRTKAISLALKRANKGDTVLLLGKGHEKTIERANGENPWDEIGATKKALQSLKP